MPFFGSLRPRLKKRVLISLAGDPSWGLLVNGRSWLCPFCAQVGVEESPAAEDARAERVLDHLVDGPCAEFREGEGATRPLPELKREVAQRELRRRVKKDLARNPAWQLMDLRRLWLCPFCGEPTEIEIPAERVMPDDTLRAIVSHVEGCAAFARGKGEPRPLEALKATVKNGNRARKLAEDVRRKVEQDPLWRQKDARARWICPFCTGSQNEIDFSTTALMFETAPELIARHLLGACERWREGATPRLASTRAASGASPSLPSSSFPERADRASGSDAGATDERSSARLPAPGISQRTGPRKQKAATDVWGRDALNAPTDPPGPPGSVSPPSRGTTLRSLESSSEHNLISDPEVKRVTSSTRPKRGTSSGSASHGGAGSASGSASHGGAGSASSSAAHGGAGVSSSSGPSPGALTPLPGSNIEDSSATRRPKSVDWRKEIERELAAVRSQVPSWNDGSSLGMEDTAQAEVRDAAHAADGIPGVEVRVLVRPANPAHGDFVEVLALGDGRLGILLGGVASEESEGALVAAMARNLLRMNARRDPDPASILRRVNQEIFQDLDARTFVSALFAVFDGRSRVLSVARAGLPAPYLVNRARTPSFAPVDCEGMVMGIDRGPIFDTTVQTRKIELAPGDLVAFVSSGILEVRNSGREEWGLERAQNAIRRYGTHEAEYLVHKMGQVLDDWTRGSDPAADACLAALKIADSPGKS